MVIEERFTVARPAQEVWDFLRNLDNAARCVPGCEEVELLDESSCRVTVKLTLARFPFRFRVKMNIDEEEPPTFLRSSVEGAEQNKGGFVNMENTMRLTASAPGETELAYRMEMRLAGRIAAFGQRIFAIKARQLSAEFARNLSDRLGAHSGA